MKRAVLLLLWIIFVDIFAQDFQFFIPYPEIKGTFVCNKVISFANCVVVYVKGDDNVTYKCIKRKKLLSDLNIFEGQKYKMVIQSVFPQKLGGHECMGPGTTGFTSIDVEGNLINIEPNNGVWDLHWIIECVDLSDSIVYNTNQHLDNK